MLDIHSGLSSNAYQVLDALTEAWAPLSEISLEAGLPGPATRAALTELTDYIQSDEVDGIRQWARKPEID